MSCEAKHPVADHVTIPSSGQNPTGCTLSIERRKQIYALAQRFDLIIIEDGAWRAAECQRSIVFLTTC